MDWNVAICFACKKSVPSAALRPFCFRNPGRNLLTDMIRDIAQDRRLRDE
jgi:hypothetical protein